MAPFAVNHFHWKHNLVNYNKVLVYTKQIFEVRATKLSRTYECLCRLSFVQSDGFTSFELSTTAKPRDVNKSINDCATMDSRMWLIFRAEHYMLCIQSPNTLKINFKNVFNSFLTIAFWPALSSLSVPPWRRLWPRMRSYSRLKCLSVPAICHQDRESTNSTNQQFSTIPGRFKQLFFY